MGPQEESLQWVLSNDEQKQAGPWKAMWKGSCPEENQTLAHLSVTLSTMPAKFESTSKKSVANKILNKFILLPKKIAEIHTYEQSSKSS